MDAYVLLLLFYVFCIPENMFYKCWIISCNFSVCSKNAAEYISAWTGRCTEWLYNCAFLLYQFMYLLLVWKMLYAMHILVTSGKRIQPWYFTVILCLQILEWNSLQYLSVFSVTVQLLKEFYPMCYYRQLLCGSRKIMLSLIM